MGGGVYHSDVRQARRSVGTTRSNRNAFTYSERASRGQEKGAHSSLVILNKIRECCDSPEHPLTTPIVLAMDVTSSRGDDAKAIHAQVPSMLGSIQVSDIVPDPQIMSVAIGDANSDLAPIQVGQFESNRQIDKDLENLWLEEGGGGTGEESYELLAYYLAKKTVLDCVTQRDIKGFCFFTGDEAPYPAVSRQFVQKYIGDTIAQDLPTEDVFRELQSKFNTFLIFPRKPMSERKQDIDKEIRKRLEQAGGKFKDVSIRASLLWHNTNDLDLHCRTPAGNHIFYGEKRARCGGELDVDRNVHGETTKPVENIRWEKGRAPTGRYEFWVENYGYHERKHGAIPFKVEIDIDGEIQTFEGEVPAGKTGDSSRQDILTFNYSPNQQEQASKDNFAAYEDEVILGKWSRYIPTSHILRVQNPASSVEAMLGVMALQTGKMNLDGFSANMQERGVDALQRADVETALSDFASQGVFENVSSDVFN